MSDWLVKFAKFLNNYEVITDCEDMDYFYHYTSLSTAKIILDGGKLRFTDRLWLNDMSEGYYIIDLTIRKINEILPENCSFKKFLLKNLNDRKNNIVRNNFYTYQCSFSIADDSLCLWNYYTAGNRDDAESPIEGANLKFDIKNIDKFIHPDTKHDIAFFYGKVCYDEVTQISIIKKIVSDFKNNPLYNEIDADFIAAYCVDKLLLQGVFFKKPCFAIENEFRIATTLYVEFGEKIEDAHFVSINNPRCKFKRYNYEIPYVDLEFNKYSLSGICLSPTLTWDIVKKKLDEPLKKYPISDNNIIVSKILVRY